MGVERHRRQAFSAPTSKAFIFDWRIEGDMHKTPGDDMHGKIKGTHGQARHLGLDPGAGGLAMRGFLFTLPPTNAQEYTPVHKIRAGVSARFAGIGSGSSAGKKGLRADVATCSHGEKQTKGALRPTPGVYFFGLAGVRRRVGIDRITSPWRDGRGLLFLGRGHDAAEFRRKDAGTP